MKLILSKQGKKEKVDPYLLKRWKVKCEHKDKTKMADDIGVGRGAVQSAFNGLAQLELVSAINEWINENK